MPRKSDPSYKTENSVFAARLREIMKERGENQTTLADKITLQYVTIQRQTISLYMSGQSKPDTERLTALARTLDVSADWLLGLTNYRTTDVDMRDACEYFGFTESAAKMILDIKNATAKNVTIRRLGWLLNEIVSEPEFFFVMRDISRLLGHYSKIYKNFSKENNEGELYSIGEAEITDDDVLDAMFRKADTHFQLLVRNLMEKAETEEFADLCNNLQPKDDE